MNQTVKCIENKQNSQLAFKQPHPTENNSKNKFKETHTYRNMTQVHGIYFLSNTTFKNHGEEKLWAFS